MADLRVVAVVQARLGSKRLPGKVLLPLGEQSLVAHLLGSLQSVVGLDEIVLAVPRGDDALVTAGVALGVEVVEGARQDVLARYALAAARTEADAVVRVTADCPLLDPDLVSLAVADYRRDPCDYLTLEGYPRGTGDVEIASAEAIWWAHRDAEDLFEREHVMPHLARRPERFQCRTLPAPLPLHRPDLRVCVDQQEDLDLVCQLVALAGPPPLPVEVIVSILDEHPELVALNAAVEQRS
jgi:spore coat polysaccharide biosynthesis protein SpsF